MKSLKNIKLQGKKVIVRLDLDIPIKNGKITDDTRLKESLPTLKLLKKAKQVIIMGHLGRPKGNEKKYSLGPIALRLSKLLNVKIKLGIPKNEKYVMLENLRFDSREKTNGLSFAKELASYADIYVNDAFATSHRNAASITGITKYLPSYPGLKVEKNIKEIPKLINNPKHPFILVLGGIKIDKLNILKNLVKKADAVLIGSAMVFAFMGKRYNENEIKLAKQILKSAKRKIILPIDVIMDNKKTIDVEKIPIKRKAYDIGPKTILIYSEMLKQAKTIVWNGPLGFYEGGYTKSTKALAKVITNSKATTIIGGGDTTHCLKNSLEKVTHYTTAGGAFLQLVSGKELIGIKALRINTNA